MEKLAKTGRIFYGVAMAEMGLQSIYCRDFPYFLLPPNHIHIPGLAILAIVFGVFAAFTGLCVVFEKGVRQISLLFGGVLLLIFCFYHVPYQFLVSPNYMHLGDWENAEKELSMAAGGFIVAGCFRQKEDNNVTRFLAMPIPAGPILFAIPIISFGILHFLEAKDVAEYVPAWVPYRLFWAYFCGAALLSSGIAILLKIKIRLAATLLGIMVFLWFLSLHTPRVIMSAPADLSDELTSAFLALAYSGIAWVIGGAAKMVV